MKFYFVTTGMKNKQEMDAIKILKPKNLMLSYYYWKNVDLGEFIKFIGYKPNIFYDSGAYSAFTKGKEIDFEKYLSTIQKNLKHIEKYACLDKLGDDQKSFEVYQEMRKRGFKPVPVFHYMGDEKYLEKYIADGNELIALGGTVPIKSKSEVAEWVRMLSWLYPEARFHLLGSASRKILDHCDIESADASTWIMKAIMGEPRHIDGNDGPSRTKRAIYNMKEYIDLYDRKENENGI